MRGRFMPWAGSMLAAAVAGLSGLPQAYASTSFTTQHDEIVVNGSTISSPLGFVYQGTTYMPIWYVMQALKTLGIQSTWKGGVWNLTKPGLQTISAINQGRQAQVIAINGSPFAGVQMYDYPDPSTGKQTAFAPVWYIMQALKKIGVDNTWNGKTWTVTTSQNLDYGLYHKVALQNQANDSEYFERANPDYYLAAQTGNPFVKDAKNTSAMSVDVGQTIYLEADASNFDVTRQDTTWIVDSSDATVKPFYQQNVTWSVDSQLSSKQLQIAFATFTASKPGVYTVQAKVSNNYTVPLVITVGLSDLASIPLQQPAGQSGMKPLSTTIPVGTNTSDAGYTYSIGKHEGNWIPVFGTAPTGTTEMTIQLQNQDDTNEWTYMLPVTDGKFGADVFSPVTGSIYVDFIPNFLQKQTTATDTQKSYSFAYLNATISSPPPSLQQVDLLASAEMDYNMNPHLANVATTLMENSPSFNTGLEAINNYVANSIKYNTAAALNPGQYVVEDANTAYNTHLGVCADYARVEASMLRSIGIRAETVSGNAYWYIKGNKTVSPEGLSHEWLRVWSGNAWVTADPTWSTEVWTTPPGQDFIDNNYFTATTLESLSHQSDASQIGADS